MFDPTSLLRDLVSIPSINPMGRDLQGPEIYEYRLTDHLEGLFRELGVPWERQQVAPRRENIVAVCEPPGATSTLVLEVHQDTVPVDNMTINPFGARVDGGKLYGRGACDVKGGMASMLAAFSRIAKERPRGAARVVLACTVDEEFTFLGVQRLVRDDLRGGHGGPVRAVVAEPTGLDIVHASPESVRLKRSPLDGSAPGLMGEVRDVIYMGSSLRMSVAIGPSLLIWAELRDDEAEGLAVGSKVLASWSPAAAMVLKEGTG